jgi:DNA-3-methyladenine glycosylase
MIKVKLWALQPLPKNYTQKRSSLQETMKYRILPQDFYARDSAIVAQNLLGKILVRKIGGKILAGKIVETEAYYGAKDPASRAFGGKKTKLNEGMWAGPGKVFVYMVHNNWMFNIVTGQEGVPAAVLIRAIEPLHEIEEMFHNRRLRNSKVDKVEQLCSGPGKLSQCFKIDRSLQGVDVTKPGELFVLDNSETFKIVRSHRIGVRHDLRQKLRFYIKGNRFVSRKQNQKRVFCQLLFSFLILLAVVIVLFPSS